MIDSPILFLSLFQNYCYMKRIFTITLLVFLSFSPFLLRGSTCTWTGAGGNDDWNNINNWSCGAVPTDVDDVVFPTSASVTSSIKIVINSLTLPEGIYMNATSSVAFTVQTITFNSTSSGSFNSSILGFSSVTVNAITLSAPNPNYVTLELQNAVLNGAVNTNLQSLRLTGIVALNSGCSFSGGTGTAQGVEFNNATVTLNSGISISSSAVMNGTFQGSGSLTFGNGGVFFGGGSSVSNIYVPVTVNSSVTGVFGSLCSNVVFNNPVTLNVSSDYDFSSIGTTTKPLEFKSTINSNRNFNIQGNPGSVVKFTNATVDIAGTTSKLGVHCEATLTNSIFNDEVGFTKNTDFFSGTFNSVLRIGSSVDPTKIFKIKSGGAKKILGFTDIQSTVNWEADNIEKASTTQIIISSSGTLNILISTPSTILALAPTTDSNGSLINDGTINMDGPSSFCTINVRTWNRSSGKINVLNGKLFLRYVELSGTTNISTTGTLSLGGFNQVHYIQSDAVINGTGNSQLVISLGDMRINHAFNMGNIGGLTIGGGAYLSGTGSVTVPANGVLYWGNAWTTIPITVNGRADAFGNNVQRMSNTVTINGTLNWDQGLLAFSTNGQLKITPSGKFKVAAVNGMTELASGATNAFIENCGILDIQANATFTVPYTSCATTKIIGVLTTTFQNNQTVYNVSPGNSPGILTINPSVSAASTAVFDMEIVGGFGAAGTADDADQLASSGNIALNGTLHLILNNPDIGSYTIFNSTGGSISGFSGMTILYSINGGAYTSTLPPNVIIQTNLNTVVIMITGSVLPVELLSFQAKNTEGSNKLTWQTATEKNVRDFDVEKSSDGKVFEKIGTVKAKGNSSTPQYYAFSDDTPFDLTYYRLKINDLDNKTDYSKTVSIHLKAKGLTAKAFPNPTNDVLNVQIEVEKKSDITIDLKDILGRTIWQTTAKNTEGSLSLPIPMSAFANGTYFLTIANNETIIQQKVVKN